MECEGGLWWAGVGGRGGEAATTQAHQASERGAARGGAGRCTCIPWMAAHAHRASKHALCAFRLVSRPSSQAAPATRHRSPPLSSSHTAFHGAHARSPKQHLRTNTASGGWSSQLTARQLALRLDLGARSFPPAAWPARPAEQDGRRACRSQPSQASPQQPAAAVPKACPPCACPQRAPLKQLARHLLLLGHHAGVEVPAAGEGEGHGGGGDARMANRADVPPRAVACVAAWVSRGQRAEGGWPLSTGRGRGGRRSAAAGGAQPAHPGAPAHASRQAGAAAPQQAAHPPRSCSTSWLGGGM